MSKGIIDLAALQRLLEVIGGDPEDLDELLADFIATAPELTAQIDIAAKAGDLDALRIAAHTLKSNARDFGAVGLSDLCEELERMCRSGTVTYPRAHAEAIAAAEAAARRALGEIKTRGLT